MLCEHCKSKPACVHITKIINNQKVEKHLCQECAQGSGEMNFSMVSDFSVNDFLKGMFNYEFVHGTEPKTETSCPNCGMTYNDFSRSGKIGCSTCYQVFGAKLEPLVRRIHGTCGHTGKVPKRGQGTLEIKLRLKKMKQELERHIASEEYEQAAKLRDEIRALEKQTGEAV